VGKGEQEALAGGDQGSEQPHIKEGDLFDQPSSIAV